MIIFVMASFIKKEISLAVTDEISDRTHDLLAHKCRSGYNATLWYLAIKRFSLMSSKCLQIITHSPWIHFSTVQSYITKNPIPALCFYFTVMRKCNKARNFNASNFVDFFLHGKNERWIKTVLLLSLLSILLHYLNISNWHIVWES